MMWREPALLWLLAPVLGLVAVLLYAQRGRAAQLRAFAESALAARMAQGLAPRRRVIRLVLRVAVLALIVLALAGPKYGFRWEQVRREGIDLIVAVDTSRSMLATDVVPNRLERAKLAVLDLIPRLRGDRIGLVAFAGTAFLETPLTLDYTAFARSLRALQVGIIPRGGTSLSRAIETSLDAFEAREGKYEALILITDGEDHEGEALEAAEKAGARGVRIFTVGIGTPEGELLPLEGGAAGFVKDRKGQVVKSRLNESLLRDLALNTSGAYVRGLGPQLGLDEVFDQHIAQMERREVETGLERRYEERFQLPLLLALLLLWIEAAVGERARGPLRRPGWLRRRRRLAAAAGLVGIVVVQSSPAEAGLFDAPSDPINSGVDLYSGGDYEAAMAKFGEALVESPASPLLQFNLAASLYKQQRYEEAVAALEKVATEGGADWVARANYNLGNAQFELGAAAEDDNPQQALERWAQALLAYRRAIGADSADEDARYNHELTQRRIAALQERLEQDREEQEPPEEDGEPGDEQEQPEQQQDEEGEQPPEQQEQEQDEGEDQDQQAGEPEEQANDDEGEAPPQQEPGEDEEQPEPGEDEASQNAADDAADDAAEEQQESGDSGAAEPGEEAPEGEQLEEQAARAVLDTAREEELGPEEIRRDVGVVGLGDPRQDW